MKRIAALLLSLLLVLGTAACGQEPPAPPAPEISQMRRICDLSVMDCYYHNVAKYFDEDASGILWWQKDKHFWIEYSGVVSVGIDASRLTLDVQGQDIVITLPQAQVLSSHVEEDSLSYIVDKKSAHVTGENEVEALRAAQEQLEESASQDTMILVEAEERVKKLLTNYVDTLMAGSEAPYTLRFETAKSVPAEPAPTTPQVTPIPGTESPKAVETP